MREETRGSGIALIGTGRLARAFATALVGSPWEPVRIASRTPSRARRVAAAIPGVVAERDPVVASARARVVLLAVPDAAIAPTARALVAISGAWRGRVALHAAGALGPEPLSPLAEAGAAVGVLHPLQALGDPGKARERLRGARARVEGAPAAVRAARSLARAVGLVPLRLAATARGVEDARALYHAAASLASNDVLALLALAAEVLERAGLGAAEARRALAPMARAVVSQFEELGERAATGPVVRGDVATVLRQMEALRTHGTAAAEAHAALGRWLLERAPGLSPGARRAIASALRRGRPPDRAV